MEEQGDSPELHAAAAGSASIQRKNRRPTRYNTAVKAE